MDYTTVDRVKSALKIESSGADALLATLVTASSRALDRLLTGAKNSASDDYLEQAAVADEVIRGRIDNAGLLHVWPRKPVVTAVTALAYRFSAREDWNDLELGYITFDDGEVIYWGIGGRGEPLVKVSYTGGYATDVADLPADVIEAATVIAARYYREDESGLTDTIGVAEIGQQIYTKAWPVRVLAMVQPFRRVVGW